MNPSRLALCFVSGLILLACVPPAPPVAVASALEITAFIDVNVVPLDSERVLAGQTVLTQGGTILAVGPQASTAVPAGARVIDGRGKYLLPGLADMHAHIAGEEDLMLYLSRGITTVRNMWGAPIHLAYRERVRKGELVGPSIVTAGPIVDGDPPAHDGSLVIRTEDDADRAVALHVKMGYDFVKAYSRLSLPAYLRLVTAAKRAGLPVAGHVPRAVGLPGIIDAREDAVEHLTGFLEALQAEYSPVRGKFDRASEAKKIDFVDEARLPALAGAMHDHGVWSCPTLSVLHEMGPGEAQLRFQRPETKYVAPLFLSLWQPGKEPSPETVARGERTNALNDRITLALRDAGARLLVGTDTGNPFIVPGFSVHEELGRLVHAGLTPYQALRAATRDAAEFLGRASEVGVVAPGQRADLLLVTGNPLVDIARTGHIAGVMARGRWFGEVEIASLLERVAVSAKGGSDPFAGMAPLAITGKRLFSATYEVVWKGARFGFERLLVEQGEGPRTVIHAQSFDGQYNQRSTLDLFSGAAGDGERLTLESDGAKGRGHITVKREAGRARTSGTLLPGLDVQKDEPLSVGVLLGVEEFLASKVLLGQRLQALSIDQEIEIPTRTLALGSSADLAEDTVRARRAADTTIAQGATSRPARRYDLTPKDGPKSVLWLDQDGYPIAYQIAVYGAPVQFNRVE